LLEIKILKRKLNILLFDLIFKAFIATTSRTSVFMKCYPSANMLNNSIKQHSIQQLLNDINIDLDGYHNLLTNSIIKEKQILTPAGKEILMLPEHRILIQMLNEKYPEHHIDSECSMK
jgi:hypothetical protein